MYATLLQGVAYAQQTSTNARKVLKTRAQWVKTENGFRLVFALDKLLNEKQMELINSGFSTFSQLLVFENRDKQSKDETSYEISCTVKFDLWEEQYDLARLDKENPKAYSVKSFGEYSKLCLTSQMANPKSLERYKKGTRLIARLNIDQISAAKASEIKEWLVRQQSGVMRGIFAHMLGNLELSESLIVEVEVPPQP